MDKLKKALVISGSRDSALELTEGAKGLAEEVVLVSVGSGDALVNAEKAYYIRADESSFVLALPVIENLAEELAPSIILLEASPDGRLAAGILAAKFSTSTLADSTALTLADGKVCSRRMVYGGKAFKTEICRSPVAVACVNAGVFSKGEAVPAAAVEEIPYSADDRIRFVSHKAKQVQQVNLAAAKKVVGVGRGVKTAEELEKVAAFAELIGAELGCTRPVAEEDKLLPRERYIGVSGCITKPDIYIAMGLSGQIQHTVGVSAAKVIIAVNKDKNAPIFKQCDYGIVGDVQEVLAALGAELKK